MPTRATVFIISLSAVDTPLEIRRVRPYKVIPTTISVKLKTPNLLFG
jgi:hypothetical protein